MKILVTGADGQLGRHLGRAFSARPWHSLLVGRNDLDLVKKSSIFACVSSYKPDIIINTAAFTAVDNAEAQPELAYAVNAQGAGSVSAAAATVDAVVIQISTDYVFAGDGQQCYTETDPTLPVNIYGHSKRVGEVEVIRFNPKHIVLRTSWLFSENSNNFLQTMLRLGKQQAEIGVVNDQFGGPTYVGDLVSVIFKIIDFYEKKQRLEWGIYHYCGYPHASWFEFAREIFLNIDAAPRIRPISTFEFPTAAKRPFNSRLDCAKINRLFGISPSDWKSAVSKLTRYK